MSKWQKQYLPDSRQNDEQGYTLLELMAVIALLSSMLVLGMPLVQTQFYERELEHAARQLIYAAQFARQHALYRGRDTVVKPRTTNQTDSDWQSGWQVEYANEKKLPIIIALRSLSSNIIIHPQGFIDPHSSTSQIRFNPAGAAKSKHGGFVANRLVMSHAKNKTLQRHVVLAASGRWRICNPNAVTQRKGLTC